MIYTENEIKEVASISKSSPVAKIAVAEVITIDTDEVKEEESVPEIEQDIIRDEKKWKWIATVSLFVFAIAILSFFILRYVGYAPLASLIQSAKSNIDKSFYLFMLAGFLAQMVDGAVGMGYGVTSTSLLMSMGVPPAAISGSVHTAEIFSSAASGYSHYKFGNVNKKLFKVLVIPGVLGAVAGAGMLVWMGDKYGNLIKPFLAAYCMILGFRILYQAYKRNKKNKKVKRAGWLAGAGGFLDSFGGGGWGPLVTSTLISKGRSPQYVIGSVSLSEFFVTLSSAMSFFVFIGITHWQVIMGLMIGGAVAAPLAAKLAGKLPVRTMLICVGLMVIIWSIRVLVKFLV
ncbi:MAG TPA: sulfite exporter TauE/SafE family protein [Chitinophagaceae bacterium]|nr:sulfite exporter TauE/SafE family protein [Chitinophagaceae bacterium]